MPTLHIVPLSDDDTPNAGGHVTGQRQPGARHTSCPYIGATVVLRQLMKRISSQMFIFEP
jgi:hypothetical protein